MRISNMEILKVSRLMDWRTDNYIQETWRFTEKVSMSI